MNVHEHDNVKFISRAINYDWMSWEFRDSSGGTPFSAEDAVSYRGLIIDGFNDEVIIIYNASWDIDGWQIRSVFHKNSGEVVYSNWATIRLVGDQTWTDPDTIPVRPDRPVVIDVPDGYDDEDTVPIQPTGEEYIGPTTLYVTASGALLRTGPTENASFNGYREAGETVVVEATINGWLRLAGTDLYISGSNVSSDRWDVFQFAIEKYGTIMLVDLSEQHAYCYVDYSCIGETDCVTGDAYSSPTPYGLYRVWSKQADFNMLDDPRYYTTYATFFNDGIAIHDADGWRSEYGGSIYQGNGSHGCVNTPAWFAELVYQNSTNGTPVLVVP